MTPREVIDHWATLTGEHWRLLPHSVQHEAAEFCTAGFTLPELALVVAYTQRMIIRGEGGFNAQSITWRVLAADRWQKFQERLTAARKTKLARRYLQPETRNQKPETSSPTAAPEAASKATAEALRKYRATLRGQ